MSFQNKEDWILISQPGRNGLHLPARLMVKHAGGWIESISVGFVLNLLPVEGSAYSCTQGRIKLTILSHNVKIILSAIPVGNERTTLINRESTLRALATRSEYQLGQPVSAQEWPPNRPFPETWGGASSKVPLPNRTR